MLNRNYLANPYMLSEKRLPARTLLLPAQKKGITHKNFIESDRILLLSGDWKFRYLEEDTSEEFFRPGTEDRGWDTLPVPSMWQYHGYGTCLYPNVCYCFPYDPPYIHRDNPVGLYRLTFTAGKNNGRIVLRFLGVDNAYFVWLNGAYVGFSKGSRIPAEFDVTDVLLEGENLLAVKVYTYSDASYLENQDMLMASGIFRDVMLIQTGENALWDYTILPDRTGVRIKYTCTVGNKPAALRFTLTAPDGTDAAATECQLTTDGEVFLPVENMTEWNAEQPALYTLFTEILEDGSVIETHTKKIGLAKSAIAGHFLTMNGCPITLKGVNRHENNPWTGRAITAEQIERELKDIKACGLNAIRASHYTNHPVFYELASELGIYVMDEADCESHGASSTGDQGALNKDPEWFDAFYDRASRMYYINKNETCINIWSLGNECGEGRNNEKCVEWLTDQDVKKPIKENCNPEIDVLGQFHFTGYMPMRELYATTSEDPLPLLMVEYAHAMGNSPGGLEDIWNWVYENEHCCGGYVWEFKSHGFYTKGKDGRARYLYGGDFPDLYHWSNFSLDGFHTSDGRAKPAWDELREVSAPVHVRWKEDGISVKNTYDFTTLDGVVLRWFVKADGISVRSGEICLDGLAPRQWQRYQLPFDTEGLVGLITADCEFYGAEAKIAHKQKILADIPHHAAENVPYEHRIHTFDHDVTVTGENFCLEIREGLPSRLEKDGRVLFDSPMKLNLWRAPTDNDGIIGFAPRHAGEWAGNLVHSMIFGCHHLEVIDTQECVTVTAEGKFLPHSHCWGFHTCLIYRVYAGGVLDVSVSLKHYGGGPGILPRVGVYFRLPEEYRTCTWLGRGPGENYTDRKACSPVGLYSAEVENMNFEYDVPQETGNRGDCRRLTVAGGELALSVSGEFSFSLHDFTLENLTAARHADELEHCAEKYLYIDYLHRGLGSHSCGPEPEAEYELPMQDFEWTFRILPENVCRSK